jgi:hypothetical protein
MRKLFFLYHYAFNDDTNFPVFHLILNWNKKALFRTFLSRNWIFLFIPLKIITTIIYLSWCVIEFFFSLPFKVRSIFHLMFFHLFFSKIDRIENSIFSINFVFPFYFYFIIKKMRKIRFSRWWWWRWDYYFILLAQNLGYFSKIFDIFFNKKPN